MFGGKEKQQSEQEKEAQLQQIEKEIQEHANAMSAISGSNPSRQNIPDVTFNFELGMFSLTLVNDINDYRGVTLSAQGLNVGV